MTADRRRWMIMGLFAGLTACAKTERATASESVASATVEPIPVNRLCATSGAIEPKGANRFAVTAPTFRAVCSSRAESRAELRFTYLGPTATTRALGSGAVRQQLGLKLRAQDPCNLLYVMWRLEPESKVVVSVKRNVVSTSAECGNHGYTNLRALSRAPVPAVTPGSSHILRAELVGAILQVTVDGVLVWKGALGADALAIDGPVGMRTDNVRIEAELRGAMLGGGPPCAAGSEAPE
jgi:hypothetical protein